MTHYEKVLSYLQIGKKVHRDDVKSLFGIPITSFSNILTLIRKDGYKVDYKKGFYKLTGHKKVKKLPRYDRKYVSARMKLMEEAEEHADTHCAKNSLEWDYCFCTKMCELATEHLGCKESWQ